MTSRCVTHLAVKPEPGGDVERRFYALSYAPSEKRYSELRNEDVANPMGARFSLPLAIVGDDGETVIGAVTELSTSIAGFRVKGRLTRSAVEAKADAWEHAELWAQVHAEKAALGLIFVPDEGKDVPLPGGGRRYDSFEVKAFTLSPIENNRDARLVVGKTICYPLPAKEKPQRPAVKLVKAADQPRPVYVPIYDVREDFERALATLPEAQRKQVSALRSMREGRVWSLRDARGAEIATVAPPAEQAKPVAKNPVVTLPRNLEKRLAKLEKNALPFPIEKFAEALGGVMGEAIRPLLKRIEALENGEAERIKAIEKRLETYERSTEGRGIRFMGRYDRNVYYEKGDVCTHSNSIWIATTPTNNAPGASGDWQRMLSA